MNPQSSFLEPEYRARGKNTRRDRFFSVIEAIAPWAVLAPTVISFRATADERGYVSIGLSGMLYMHVMRQCSEQPGKGIVDALYDGPAVRHFVGIGVPGETVRDVTRLVKFRQLRKTHQLTEPVFNAINALLGAKGPLLREGTSVSAMLTAASPATENRKGKRDEEMLRMTQDQQRFFSLEMHSEIDLHLRAGGGLNGRRRRCYPSVGASTRRRNRSVRQYTLARREDGKKECRLHRGVPYGRLPWQVEGVESLSKSYSLSTRLSVEWLVQLFLNDRISH